MPNLAAVAAARRFATRRGLPALTGSPAQIEWAEEVRMRLVKNFDASMRSASYRQRSLELQQLREWALTHTSAAWWIDQRFSTSNGFTRLRNMHALESYAVIMGKKSA